MLINLVEGVIHDGARATFALRDHSSRGKFKMRIVADGLIWQDDPKAHVNIIQHVF
jgi:hypothetical protein